MPRAKASDKERLNSLLTIHLLENLAQVNLIICLCLKWFRIFLAAKRLVWYWLWIFRFSRQASQEAFMNWGKWISQTLRQRLELTQVSRHPRLQQRLGRFFLRRLDLLFSDLFPFSLPASMKKEHKNMSGLGTSQMCLTHLGLQHGCIISFCEAMKRRV